MSRSRHLDAQFRQAAPTIVAASRPTNASVLNDLPRSLRVARECRRRGRSAVRAEVSRQPPVLIRSWHWRYPADNGTSDAETRATFGAGYGVRQGTHAARRGGAG